MLIQKIQKISTKEFFICENLKRLIDIIEEEDDTDAEEELMGALEEPDAAFLISETRLFLFD